MSRGRTASHLLRHTLSSRGKDVTRDPRIPRPPPEPPADSSSLLRGLRTHPAKGREDTHGVWIPGEDPHDSGHGVPQDEVLSLDPGIVHRTDRIRTRTRHTGVGEDRRYSETLSSPHRRDPIRMSHQPRISGLLSSGLLPPPSPWFLPTGSKTSCESLQSSTCGKSVVGVSVCLCVCQDYFRI